MKRSYKIHLHENYDVDYERHVENIIKAEDMLYDSLYSIFDKNASDKEMQRYINRFIDVLQSREFRESYENLVNYASDKGYV